MKRIAIATTAAFLALGAAAYAQQGPGPGPGQGGPRMEERQERMERRAARMEERFNRRIERLKTELKLTPAQEALWGPVQAHFQKIQQERRAFRQTNLERMRTAELPERLDLMAGRAERGAQNMRELSAAVKPLWASLDATQKEIVRKYMPGPGGGRWGERGERGRDRN